MSEGLDAFSKESGYDPAEVKEYIQQTYRDIFPVIEKVSTAGDAVNLFKRWESTYSSEGQFLILDALAVFNDLQLISAKSYESVLLLLDYASSHNIIELDCSKFVENAESPASSQIEISIEQLRQAVIADYAYLCADDGGTAPDEISLEDYKKSVSEMTWDQLMQETCVNADKPSDNPNEMTLEEYVDFWRARSQYADFNYIKNQDGSTSLIEEKSDFDQDIGQGSITREQLINAMVNEWIVNCYCAPDEDDDPPEVKRKEFESMTNEELLESTGCDEIYTIQSFVAQYQQIADEYLQVFDSSSSDTKATMSREKSLVARVIDFLRRVRSKIRQLLNFD